MKLNGNFVFSICFAVVLKMNINYQACDGETKGKYSKLCGSKEERQMPITQSREWSVNNETQKRWGRKVMSWGMDLTLNLQFHWLDDQMVHEGPYAVMKLAWISLDTLWVLRPLSLITLSTHFFRVCISSCAWEEIWVVECLNTKV